MPDPKQKLSLDLLRKLVESPNLPKGPSREPSGSLFSRKGAHAGRSDIRCAPQLQVYYSWFLQKRDPTLFRYGGSSPFRASVIITLARPLWT